MLRTPQPKEQARLLVTLLGQQGLSLNHQKALDIIAKLNGYRSWHVMQADSPSAQAKAPAVKAPPYTVAGFNVEDVLSVRPDLTEDEAFGVLQFCEKYYDASYGLNWDRLLDNSHQWMGPAYAVEGLLEFSGGRLEPVVVRLHDGRLYRGTLADLAQGPLTQDFGPIPFGPLPEGTTLKLADGRVEVDMSNEADAYGASSEDLRELCDELRAAGVKFSHMPK